MRNPIFKTVVASLMLLMSANAFAAWEDEVERSGTKQKDGIWYALYDDTERNIYTTSGSKKYEYTPLAPPDAVTFQATKPMATAVNGELHIQDYANSSWSSDLITVTVGQLSKNSFKDFGPVQLRSQSTIIRFYTETGSYNRTIRNVHVTQATYINLISSSTIDFGTLTVGESKADNYIVKYSNGTSGKALNMSSSNPNFVLGTTSRPEGMYAQKTFGVTFAPATSGRFSGIITLNNGASKTITLSGVAIPATVVANAATNIVANSFTANWNAAAGATSYTVSLYDANGTLLRSENTTATSFAFTGLNPAATYRYNVIANGNDNTQSAAASNTIEVTTKTPALVPNKTSIDFGTIIYNTSVDSEVSFTASYIYAALHASLAENEQFAFRNLSENGIVATFYPKAPGVYDDVLTITTDGLVSPVVINLHGVAVPTYPAALAATNVGVESFTANWNEVDDENAIYTLYVNGVEVYSGGNTSYDVTGLTPETNYKYIVKVTVNGVTSDPSKSINVKTLAPAKVDTVVWSNATGDGQWATIRNWKAMVNGEIRDLASADTIQSNLNIIIPAPENSKYLQGELTLSDTYGYAPSLSKGYGNVRLTDEKVATNIILEYGALFNVDEFAGTGVCDTIVTSMVVKGEDRGEWILAGATLQIFDETGMRPMQSGDFYLDKKPWVYMHELNVQNGENPVTSWGNAFASLTTELTPASAFAIKIENRYGKYGFPSERYYSKDSVMKYLGQQDVEYTFKGQPYTKLDYYTKADGWTVLTNIKLANIDVARLIADIEGSQVAVWSFNDEKGNKGSWEVYSAANIGDKHPMIKPTYAFLYYNTKAVSADDLVNNYLNYSSSVKYHAATQSLDAPYARPELQVKVANGNYSSVTSVIYDDTLDEDELAAANTLKVFSGYEGTPDVCTSAGGKFYYAQTVNADVTEVPLTIKTTADMNVTMTFAGVAGFDAVRLKDKLTGALYDLNDDAAIEFELLEGDNADRFVLQFDYGMSMPTTDVAEQTEDAVWVSVNGRNVRIRSVYDIQKVSFVDMLGATRTLKAQGDDLTFDMSGYPAGVCVLVVTTENGTTTEKVLIK